MKIFQNSENFGNSHFQPNFPEISIHPNFNSTNIFKFDDNFEKMRNFSTNSINSEIFQNKSTNYFSVQNILRNFEINSENSKLVSENFEKILGRKENFENYFSGKITDKGNFCPKINFKYSTKITKNRRNFSLNGKIAGKFLKNPENFFQPPSSENSINKNFYKLKQNFYFNFMAKNCGNFIKNSKQFFGSEKNLEKIQNYSENFFRPPSDHKNSIKNFEKLKQNFLPPKNFIPVQKNLENFPDLGNKFEKFLPTFGKFKTNF